MKYPSSPIWETLTEVQQAQVVALLVQMLQSQLRQKEKEEEKDDNGKVKSTN